MTELLTVVELPEFIRRASSLMTEKERLEMIYQISASPDSGISLGGGLRKIRIAQRGRGKSGSFRLVYVFSGNDIPLFLITIFAKNEKANLTTKEQALLKEASRMLIETYRRENNDRL